MIVRSLSLQHRLVREMDRHAGSLARLVFYDGVMPASCDGSADGTKVKVQDVPAGFWTQIFYGEEPGLPEGAKYWRVYTNNGDVMMQGDSK